MKKFIVFISLTFLSLILFSQVTDGLVGHFPFTNGSMTDMSGYYDCVLSSNGDSIYYLTEDRFGNVDCAIDFQGAVFDAGIISRDITTEVSISLWMKTEYETEDVVFLINKYYCVEPPLGYHLAFMGDSVTFDGRDNSSNGYMRSGWSTTKVNDGEWHHVVGVTRSEGIWEIWINGLKESSNTYLPIFSLNHLYCNLGISGPNYENEIRIFHGVLDDIRIYKRALDSLEIDSLFNESNPMVNINDQIDTRNFIIKITPNPFTTSTTIEYQLDYPSDVTLSIFNHLGKQVEFISQQQPQGKQKISWNAEGLSQGIYFYTLKAGDQLATGKMVLVRNN